MTYVDLMQELNAHVRELEQIVVLQRELIAETDQWLAFHATKPQPLTRAEARDAQ